MASGQRGKVVVVNNWGIWCDPCVQEMPEFQKLHEEYKNDTSVVILSINNRSAENEGSGGNKITQSRTQQSGAFHSTAFHSTASTRRKF